MKKEQIADLVTKILGGRVRQLDESVSVEMLREAGIHNALEQYEWIVLERVYNMHGIDSKRSYWSLAEVAKSLSTTTAKVRKFEASAIKRLCEPDCFGWFVKNFGSKEALIEQLKRMNDEFAFAISHAMGRVDEDVLSEGELASILEHTEAIHAIYKKHLAPFSLSDLNLRVLTRTALKRNAIDSLGGNDGLCSYTEKELLRLGRIGVNMVAEIKKALAEHNLELASK